MRKIFFSIILLIGISVAGFGQKYFTRSGYVRFFSSTPIENIEAINNQGSCIVDLATGEVVSKLLMKSFVFEKTLMQEHFNENYVESDLYPQAVLKGKVLDVGSFDLSKKGSQAISLNADITIHGVTKNMDIKGTGENVEGKLQANATFILKPADFNIVIPKIVANNIAKEIEVTVKFTLEPLKQ
ncbi:MAG TPA: YceI family protein [Prolixibacteraceae bacterium]|nr:YceI family protein [Prolixibacteraceae bacterium]